MAALQRLVGDASDEQIRAWRDSIPSLQSEASEVLAAYAQAKGYGAVLDELTAIRGALAHIRADNGPEMISKAVKAWCEESATGALYIDPGSPWQNGIVESFNGRLRDELLSSEIFDTLADAQYLIDRWRLFILTTGASSGPSASCHRRPSRRQARRCLRSGSLRSPARRHRRACKGQLTCTDSHMGWTDESDPVSASESRDA